MQRFYEFSYFYSYSTFESDEITLKKKQILIEIAKIFKCNKL
jgi:hypothetical protein